MSDQPKPTTVEWTAERVRRYASLVKGTLTEAQCQRLADGINSELAAERAKVKELEQLRTLTLERYLTNEQKRIIQQLREQLAAEKQRADEAEQGELNEARKLNVGDQPETGDWRVQQSNGIWLLLDCENKVITAMLSKEVALEIASRHNLALNPLMDEIERLTDQLAAGRDTWKRLESWFPLTAREIQQLRSQLENVTERNLWLNNDWLKLKKQLTTVEKEVQPLVDELAKTKRQLAAAQAAIKLHNDHVYETGNGYPMPYGDTAALDAAIAAAQQPLVDTINKLYELADEECITEAHQVREAALAKVKEGK